MHKSARTRSRENTGKAKALDAALASLTSTLGKRSQQLVTDAKKKRKLKSNAVGVPQARAEDVERAVARSPAFGGQASLSTSAETERPTTTATAAATQASVEGPVEVPASGEASSSSASSSASSTASSSAPAPAHAHAHYVDGAQVEPVLARLDRDMLVKFALAQQAALTQQSIVQFVQGEETAVKIAALEATVATLTRDLAIKMHAADAEIGHLKAQLMLACHERDELVLATLDVTNHESILSSQLQVASPDEQLTEDGAAPTTMATHAETEADADTLELPALPQHTVLENFLPSDAVASPAMDDDCDDAGSPLALPSSPGDVAALDESDMRWIMTTLEPFDQDELPLA